LSLVVAVLVEIPVESGPHPDDAARDVQAPDRATIEERGIHRSERDLLMPSTRYAVAPQIAADGSPSDADRAATNNEKSMATIVRLEELPRSGNTYAFEGQEHGDAPLSFFLVNSPPGSGPRLHRHPYAEVFVVQEGHASFTVGDEALEITGGQIVVVPPGTPHKFVNVGDGLLRQVDIHPAGRMATEWLEE
jgi:mannose-6-phosphate isomerase-like protein (cupin superfamily)